MTLLQASLIAGVAALTQLDGAWLGEMKLREPIITGFLVGLIMGDMTKGLLIGAQLQMIWMGATGIGPTAQLDIGTGGTIGAAVALVTGKGAASAILFGLPVAVIMQFVNTLLLTGYSALMQKVDNDVSEHKFNSIARIHYLCGFISFLMYFSLTFVPMYFGNSIIKQMVNGLPKWANSGMNAVAALLPAMGFALLLNIILEKKLIPFFIIGFIPAAFIGEDLTMVGITAVAVAIAWIMFMLLSNQNNQSNNDSKQDTVSEDEWED